MICLSNFLCHYLQIRRFHDKRIAINASAAATADFQCRNCNPSISFGYSDSTRGIIPVASAAAPEDRRTVGTPCSEERPSPSGLHSRQFQRTAADDSQRQHVQTRNDPTRQTPTPSAVNEECRRHKLQEAWQQARIKSVPAFRDIPIPVISHWLALNGVNFKIFECNSVWKNEFNLCIGYMETQRI